MLRTVHPATPALAVAVLVTGCIEPAWEASSPVVLAVIDPLAWDACDDPCHLEEQGEVRRLDGLSAEVSSETGFVCAVPSPDDVAWSVVPNEGSRLLPVGEDEADAVAVEASACEQGAVGDPCEPIEAGDDAHLFLVAMGEGDRVACELLRGSDFAKDVE